MDGQTDGQTDGETNESDFIGRCLTNFECPKYGKTNEPILRKKLNRETAGRNFTGT